jgi:hypothetical protein
LCLAIFLVGAVSLLVSAVELIIRLISPDIKVFPVLLHRSELMFGEALESLPLPGRRCRFRLEAGLDEHRLNIRTRDVAGLRCTGRDQRN